nr:transposase [Chromobacterium amazonense]
MSSPAPTPVADPPAFVDLGCLDPSTAVSGKLEIRLERKRSLGGAALDYQTSRSGQHVAAFLADWQGTLMVDDYAGYKALFREGVEEQACWAHARRKFYDLHKDLNHPVAAEALTRISRLCAIEAEGRELTIEERHRLRQQRSQPELEALLKWLADLTPAPGTGLYRAVLTGGQNSTL